MSDFMRLWSDIDKRHTDAKDSQGAIPELFSLYASLDASERDQANSDLFDVLRHGTEGQRYDALAIINEFRVADALPALRELAVRLQIEDSPGAPFELAKVDRIIARLKPK